MESPPFDHLNLRRNPFGDLSEHGGAIERIAGPVDLWARRLDDADRMLEFVGPRGSGKSVRLRASAEALRNRTDGQVELVEVEGLDAVDWPKADYLFVDEAQFVRGDEWRELAELAPRSLAVASHESLRGVAERLGFEVMSIDCAQCDASRIRHVVSARIRAVQRVEGSPPVVSQSACAWLASAYGCDLRRSISHLYEVFQQLETPTEVTVDHLTSTRPPEPSSVQPHPRASEQDGVWGWLPRRIQELLSSG